MKFVDLAKKTLRTVGVYGSGQPLNAIDVRVVFDLANEMLDAWAAQRLTVYQTLRITVPTLTAGKGGVSNPYTVGLGGDINIQRPGWISTANLIVKTTNPTLETPLAIFKPEEYAAIAIKDLASSLATGLYFDGAFATTGAKTGLGNLYLYPVPNGGQPLGLALYIPTPLRGFADIDATDYTFPPGYEQALHYQLVKRAAGDFQRDLSAEVQSLIVETFKVIADQNAQTPNISSDVGVPGMGSGYGLYNWRTGSNSRRGRA
ncbi:MAG TPA: hypothetical protein PKZ07_16040 [Sedimentisphaerales bacterium]|nr:hypothetical protein [Sedimentisphaerales bacterium]